MIPYMTFLLIGFALAIYDFIIWQQFFFQFNYMVILGIIFGIIGGYFWLVRRSLSAAGFGSILKTPRLRIVKGHKLVTTGYYKHIRHPIYTGELFRNSTIPLILSSWIGIITVTFAFIFLIIRIKIEEDLLLETFGEEYEDYRKSTKKLIPFLY